MKRITEGNDSWIELDRNEIIIGFVDMCVTALSRYLQLPAGNIVKLLSEKNLLEGYIVKEYDMLHIESMGNIIDKIMRRLNI